MQRLAAGFMPYWRLSEEPRNRYSLALPADVQLALYKIADMFLITNHLREDSYGKHDSMISAVLEAIGIEYLTPIKKGVV